MNLFDLFIFSSGTIFGIYLNQKYRLPDVEQIVKNTITYLQKYEPPRKENMDID